MQRAFVVLSFSDVLNEHFASTLLNVIEDDSQPGDVAEAATACLIAFNLHFREDNLITLALRQKVDNATKLTESLLLLVNKKGKAFFTVDTLGIANSLFCCSGSGLAIQECGMPLRLERLESVGDAVQ